jgi:type II secretory pathway pseudopilin PulG
MGQNTLTGKGFNKQDKRGYVLLTAIIAINIFAILAMAARSMWETEIQLDLEAELLFRARQYKTAIEMYTKKNLNLSPQNLEILHEKKFLRKLFKDPMSEDGKWNIVMKGGRGQTKGLLIVPEDMLPQYVTQARIIGVCSTSPEEGIREYRGKKRYSEWAVYVGEQVDKEMPELKFVGEEEERK